MSKIDKEAVRWAYRLFLDREPETESVLENSFGSTRALREALLSSAEYRNNNVTGGYTQNTWVIKETVHGFRIWVSLSELGVSRPILGDTYDSKEAQLLKTIIKEGDTVFDIGANIGFYSLLLSRIVGPGGRVFGFEPLLFLCDKARKSVNENGYQEFCLVQNLALSNAKGTLNIRHAPVTTNFGGGYIAPDTNTPTGHVDEKVSVSRLDEFITQSQVKFIKIDVEGAEPLVIEGGKSLINRDHPVILSELHNAQLKTVSNSSATKYIRQLDELGYSCYAITDSAFSSPIESYNADHPTNVLFMRRG